MAISLLLASLVAVQAQEQALPWRTDLAAARQESLKAGKPCILLINVDRDTTSLGSVEFHLARSPEMRKLCSTVTVAILRQHEPAALDLMKEFDDGYFAPCKIAVLDRKGETLAFFAAWELLTDSTPEAEKAFASKLVTHLQECLQRQESVEQLERRWQSEGNDPGVLDRLLTRLEEMTRSEKASKLMTAAAADESRSLAVRNVARAWDFPLLEEGSSGEAHLKYVVDAENLLEKVAPYEGSVQVLRSLMESGYGNQFDVPDKVASALARLGKAAAAQPDPAPLRKRIAELSGLFREWKADFEKELREYQPDDDSIEGARVKAMLGDAGAALKVLGALPEKERLPYRAWIEEARAKQARDKK